MPPPTISDLFLAFRQAKLSLYFERRGVGLLALALFERDLTDNLSALHATLSENGGWFNGLPLGEVWVVPKKFRTETSIDTGMTRIGVRAAEPASRTLDIQVRHSPSPQVAIVEVLYLWRFGPTMEGMVSVNSVGYRLDLKKGSLSKTRRWLFQFWPTKYQDFRTAPLDAARRELMTDHSVIVVSADLASFYDTIDPSFLISEQFLSALRQSPIAPEAHLDSYS